MKRILVFLLLVACLLTWVSCGDGGNTTATTTLGGSDGDDVIEDNHVFDDLRYQYAMGEYVTLPSYSTHSKEVELDRVLYEIDMLIIENSKLSDRKFAVMSDVVEIVYTGYYLDENSEIKTQDGKELIFDKNEEYVMYLGSNLALKELEVAIAGMQVGEIKEVYVTMPQDYHVEELRGQRVMYEVILNAVYDAPIYNDAFIKSVFSDLSTVEEYEEYLKKSFVLEELYEIIKNGTEFIKIPEAEYKKLEDELIKSEASIKDKYGITLDEYLQKEYSMTRTEYLDSKIKSDMVLYALAEAEGVEVTLEHLKSERARLVSYYVEYYKAHGASSSEAKKKAIAFVDDLGDHYVYENVMNELLNKKMDDSVTYTEKASTYTSITSVIAERAKMQTGSNVGDLCPADNLEVFDENGSLSTTIDPTKNIGKLTVINFWGTWCPYCLVELPYFDRIAEEYTDKLTVYAVHTTSGYGTAPDYVLDNFENSEIVFLKDYALASSSSDNDTYYSKLGGAGYYPYTVILDENGRIVSKHTGAMTYEALLGALKSAGLEEK